MMVAGCGAGILGCLLMMLAGVDNEGPGPTMTCMCTDRQMAVEEEEEYLRARARARALRKPRHDDDTKMIVVMKSLMKMGMTQLTTRCLVDHQMAVEEEEEDYLRARAPSLSEPQREALRFLRRQLDRSDAHHFLRHQVRTLLPKI
jgi:hypothetical protein